MYLKSYTFSIMHRISRVFNYARSSVICHAVTSGVVPPDIIPDSFEQMSIDKEVVDLSSKFDDFSGSLSPVPPKSDSEHYKVVNQNNEKIWEYAKGQYKNKLLNQTGFSIDPDTLFNIDNYRNDPSKAGTYPYNEAMTNCKKMFARGAFAPFWEAIGIKVQLQREFEQRIGDQIGFKIDDYKEISENLKYVGRGFAYSAKTTQSRNYIMNTTRTQKDTDQKAFSKWYKSKLDPRVKILRLNISDLSLNLAFKEIVAFEQDPMDLKKRDAIEKKLLELQKEAYNEYTTQKASGTLDTWDFETWLSTK